MVVTQILVHFHFDGHVADRHVFLQNALKDISATERERTYCMGNTYKEVCHLWMDVLELLFIVVVMPQLVSLIECCANLLEIADECMLSDSQCILSSNE